MSEKIIGLAHGERIIAVVPERCSGAGWSNSPTWVHVLASDGTCRTECIQPDERSPSLMHLFNVGEVVCSALIMSVTTNRTKRPATPAKSSPKTNKREEAMASALRVMHTWASVDGALDPENVRALAKKALAGER